MQNVTAFWLKNIVEWKELLLHLIFPSSCALCSRELSRFEEACCSTCVEEFKYTYYENYREPSNLDQLFWGRSPVASSFALLYFEQGSSTQQLIHQIKYKSKISLARKMGKVMGEKILLNKEKYGEIDALIPVPLHPKKEYQRGYNQSRLLAEGISSTIHTPLETASLKRIVHAKSQTTMGRFLRWDNIEAAFSVKRDQLLQYKHVALVDDVVTTGSTLEACIRKLHEANPNLKISILTLACTK